MLYLVVIIEHHILSWIITLLTNYLLFHFLFHNCLASWKIVYRSKSKYYKKYTNISTIWQMFFPISTFTNIVHDLIICRCFHLFIHLATHLVSLNTSFFSFVWNIINNWLNQDSELTKNTYLKLTYILAHNHCLSYAKYLNVCMCLNKHTRKKYVHGS